jgi:hypothetical protein
MTPLGPNLEQALQSHRDGATSRSELLAAIVQELRPSRVPAVLTALEEWPGHTEELLSRAEHILASADAFTLCGPVRPCGLSLLGLQSLLNRHPLRARTGGQPRRSAPP